MTHCKKVGLVYRSVASERFVKDNQTYGIVHATPAVLEFTENLIHTRSIDDFAIGSITYALFVSPWLRGLAKRQVFEHFLVTSALSSRTHRCEWHFENP